MATVVEAPRSPVAGKLGGFTCLVFGIATIVVTFFAVWFYSDADRGLSAAAGAMSIAVPTVVGFAVAELRHQRAGAIAFVVAAGLYCGAVGAFAYAERDDYEDRRDQFDIPNEQSAPASGDWADPF